MNTIETIERYEEQIRIHTSIAETCKKQKRYHDNHWHRGFSEALRRMVYDIKKSFFYKGQIVVAREGLFGEHTLIKSGEKIRIVRMNGHPNPNEQGIYVTQIGRHPDGDKYSTYVNPDDIKSA